MAGYADVDVDIFETVCKLVVVASRDAPDLGTDCWSGMTRSDLYRRRRCARAEFTDEEEGKGNIKTVTRSDCVEAVAQNRMLQIGPCGGRAWFIMRAPKR